MKNHLSRDLGSRLNRLNIMRAPLTAVTPKHKKDQCQKTSLVSSLLRRPPATADERVHWLHNGRYDSGDRGEEVGQRGERGSGDLRDGGKDRHRRDTNAGRDGGGSRCLDGDDRHHGENRRSSARLQRQCGDGEFDGGCGCLHDGDERRYWYNWDDGFNRDRGRCFLDREDAGGRQGSVDRQYRVDRGRESGNKRLTRQVDDWCVGGDGLGDGLHGLDWQRRKLGRDGREGRKVGAVDHWSWEDGGELSRLGGEDRGHLCDLDWQLGQGRQRDGERSVFSDGEGGVGQDCSRALDDDDGACGRRSGVDVSLHWKRGDLGDKARGRDEVRDGHGGGVGVDAACDVADNGRAADGDRGRGAQDDGWLDDHLDGSGVGERGQVRADGKHGCGVVDAGARAEHDG